MPDWLVFLFVLGVIIMAIIIVIKIAPIKSPTIKQLVDFRSAFVQECFKLEQYTRDECIIMSTGIR